MRKDRQCGIQPYPMTPGMMGPMQGMPMAPGMMGPMQAMPGLGGPPLTSMPSTPSIDQGIGSIDQQLNRMQQQINMLDRRVSQLEAGFSEIKAVPYTSGNKYNDSSYHMM